MPGGISSDIANFVLEDLTVTVGTTVTWINLDVAPHTSTAGAPGANTGEWDSRSMGQNISFMHRFEQAGTFAFYCTIHPSMTATVTVIDTPAPPGLATSTPQPAATSTPTPQPTATSTPVPEPTAAPSGQVATDIASFQLEDLAISVGTTVTWTPHHTPRQPARLATTQASSISGR
jgi:plastocyanin